MDWDAPFVIVSDVTLKKHFSQMDCNAAQACIRWQQLMYEHAHMGGPAPPHELLLVGIPPGSIRAAELVEIDDYTYVAFKVLERSARLVDVAAFNCMRMMTLPGKDCEWWFDRSTDKNLPPEQQRLYLRFSRREGIWGLRILADAQRGEVIRQRATKGSSPEGSHRDLRLRNLYRTTRSSEECRGKRMREPIKGRDAAIDVCVRSFHDGTCGIATQDYEKLLRLSFGLLDHLHGNDVEDRRRI